MLTRWKKLCLEWTQSWSVVRENEKANDLGNKSEMGDYPTANYIRGQTQKTICD